MKLRLALLFVPSLLLACGEDDPPRADAGVAFADATINADAAAPDAANEDAASDAGVEADGGGDADAATGDAGFQPPAYNTWVKYEPAGAVCANGSPYKFFVKFSPTSSNVVIYFEGGGACWDYASCTGTGVRSAANRNGIADTHADVYAMLGPLNLGADIIYPLMSSRTDTSPMADWNKIFLPYCTGDVFSGDTTVTYEDPSGAGAPVEFHHRGHGNVLKTIESLNEMFPQIPKMFVGGCSAGGAGAIINYHFLRSGLNVEKGYLLDDSGPIFIDTASTSRSRPLHDRIRASWNVEPLIASAPSPQDISRDLGNLVTALADEYPNDRLAHTHFRLDFNYSLYSYERFYTVGKSGETELFGDGSGLGELGLEETVAEDRSAVYGMWWEDTELLRTQFASRTNLGYFMPFYRDTNSSHCLTIPGLSEFPQNELPAIFVSDFPRLAWAGTTLPVESGEMNIRQYVDHLLDDAVPLASFFEEDGEGRYINCTPDPRYYDEALCAAAH